MNGDVRLMNGAVSSEGRVEVCVWGRWSTVCADSAWDVNGAQTICQLAGFEGIVDTHTPYVHINLKVQTHIHHMCTYQSEGTDTHTPYVRT